MTRVFIDLPEQLDVNEWSSRHAAGELPDAAPYGLELLEGEDTKICFSQPLVPTWERFARLSRDRLHRLEIARILHAQVSDQRRRTADVALSMDERTGIPAALVPGGPPTVSGIAWLTDPASLSRPYRATVAAALPRMSRLFVECAPMVGVLEQKFGVSSQRIDFVELGVDVDHFSEQVGPTEDGLVFSVGDDINRDHDTLIRSIVAARRVHGEARLELATRLPVSGPTEWLTVIPRRLDSLVRGYYARARVVALALRPTVTGSGLTVILQAMACGRPLVVTANPGLEDYVEHGVTGLLVPAGDADAMGRAIGELLDDPQRCAEMGRAARRRVEQRFDSASFMARLRDVVREARRY